MNFDKEKEYKELCKKFKIEDFIEECRSEKIPFFITACVKNDENGSTYLSDASATGSRNIELKDDQAHFSAKWIRHCTASKKY